MKNSLLIGLIVSTQIFAMDFEEEKPTPQNQLQLLIPNKNISSERFTEIMRTYARLEELNASGHLITYIPTQNAPAQFLVRIDLSHGQLTGSDTLTQLLTICPYLSECSVAHNELTTLDEFKIPLRASLIKLNCSHNKIKDVNFTQLRSRLYNLKQLNLSNCPLNTFKTNNIGISNFITEVDLKNTQLNDDAKKNIIKNSSCSGATTIACCPMFTSAFIGLAVGMFTPIIAFASSDTNTKDHKNGFGLAMIISSLTGALIIGPACGYLGSLALNPPKDREIIILKPEFDEEPTYPELEVTTKHQRFVRKFPYIGNILNWCTAKKTNQGHELLTEVNEE